MSEYTLTVKKHIPASPERVFDAWTDAEGMAQWFSPMTTASIPVMDLRPGGEYRIDMHGDGKDYVHTGKYIEIERPKRLRFSWHSEGTQQKETIVTVELEADGDGTLLTLTHEQLPSEQSRAEHEGGWKAILDKTVAVVA